MPHSVKLTLLYRYYIIMKSSSGFDMGNKTGYDGYDHFSMTNQEQGDINVRTQNKK